MLIYSCDYKFFGVMCSRHSISDETLYFPLKIYCHTINIQNYIVIRKLDVHLFFAMKHEQQWS